MSKKNKLLSKVLLFSLVFSNVNSVKYLAMDTNQKFYDSKFDILKKKDGLEKYCSDLLSKTIQNWCNNFARNIPYAYDPFLFQKYLTYNVLNSYTFYPKMKSYLIEILKTIYNIMILDNFFHYEEYSQEEFLNYFTDISFGTINELLDTLNLFVLNYNKHSKNNSEPNFKFNHIYWIKKNDKIDNLFFKLFGKWMNETKSPSVKQNNKTDDLFFKSKSSGKCVSKIDKKCARIEYCKLIDAQLIGIFKYMIKVLTPSSEPLVYISYEQKDRMEIHVK